MEPSCISPHLENSVDLTSFGHTYSGSKVNVALPSLWHTLAPWARVVLGLAQWS